MSNDPGMSNDADAGRPTDGGWSEADAAPLEEQRKPPAGTPIAIERFPDGVTIEVPAAGVWKGSHGLFLLALLWNGFMGIVSVCLIGSLVGVVEVKGQGPGWIGALILSLFWAVGIGLLLGSLNMGRRRAALAVTSGSLLVIQTGLFGSKRRQWEPGEVEAVTIGPSGLEVNGTPVLELQILDGGGKFSLLAGRTDDELAWLARELRTALSVGGELK